LIKVTELCVRLRLCYNWNSLWFLPGIFHSVRNEWAARAVHVHAYLKSQVASNPSFESPKLQPGRSYKAYHANYSLHGKKGKKTLQQCTRL